MAEFLMPTLGADMTDGTLVQWKKKEGDRIAKGETIAEVDTEKAAIDVESHTTGIIERLITRPGDKVPVGTVMAIIREEGGPTTSVASPRAVAAPPSPLRPPLERSAQPLRHLRPGDCGFHRRRKNWPPSEASTQARCREPARKEPSPSTI
jgi:pyruvate dehydrogenase E2 component (dihydrolipoamide acetyltransferase)